MQFWSIIWIERIWKRKFVFLSIFDNEKNQQFSNFFCGGIFKSRSLLHQESQECFLVIKEWVSHLQKQKISVCILFSSPEKWLQRLSWWFSFYYSFLFVISQKNSNQNSQIHSFWNKEQRDCFFPTSHPIFQNFN